MKFPSTTDLSDDHETKIVDQSLLSVPAPRSRSGSLISRSSSLLSINEDEENDRDSDKRFDHVNVCRV